GFGAAGESSSSTTMSADTSGTASATTAETTVTGVDTSTTMAPGTEETTTGGPAGDEGGGGCGCTNGRTPAAAWTLVFVPWLIRRRRDRC
ncbi:MAG TPA: hypothetical protein VG755_37925, partial [Nannocystaceae bacterium]|nr:hypothetical protein [Nannocystaceae bacterium]